MMIKKNTLLPLAVAASVLGLLIVVQVASATHPRPKSATSVKVALVPAFEECPELSANRTHGPPLAFPSCNPPVQRSSHLTVGSPDANGAGANSVGSVVIKVIKDPCCPETGDVAATATLTDVRCTPATSASVCGTANAAGGPDYSGQLEVNSMIRITDHWNSTSPGGGSDAATVIDIPFPITFQCGSTASTSIGGTCSVTATEAAIGPPSPTVARAVVEITQLQVFDGGSDGVVSTTPNDVFAVQGIFIP